MKKLVSLLLSFTMLLSIVSVVDFSAFADTLTTGKCGENVTYSFDESKGVLTISGTGDMNQWPEDDSPWYADARIKTLIIDEGVTSIGDRAFQNCSNLSNIQFPKSLTLINGDAFLNCTSLTSVTIPDGVKRIHNSAFEGCKRLTSFSVNEGNSNYSSQGGVLFNKDKTELIQYPIGNERTTYDIPNSVTSIGNSAFSECTNLSNVTIPDSVTRIGDSAFESCTSLTSVIIPNSLISIDNSVFQGCTSLTSVTIPNSVTSIGNSAFDGCTSLTKVTIGNSVTDIGFSAFEGCASLTSVTIPDSVISISGSAFSSCTSLTSITIPDSVTSIGWSAFSGCTSLTSVTIGNGVTSIDYFPFFDCSNLNEINYNGTISQWKSIQGYSYVSKPVICTDGVFKNIVTIDSFEYEFSDHTASIVGYTGTIENLTIPESISYEDYTFEITSIADSAFSNCASLKSVTIPDSVTRIGDSAFEDCTSLTSIKIPYSVTSIGFSAFVGCKRLTSFSVNESNSNYSSQDGVLFNKDKTEIIQYPIGNERAIYDVPNSVNSIRDSAFYGCVDLNKIYYSGTKSQWKAINIGSNNDKLIENLVKCTDGFILNKTDATDAVTDNLKYKLNYDETAEIVGYEDSQKAITIPESIYYKGFTFKVTNIGNSAFKNCKNLISITIPSSVTTICGDTFSNCTNLTSVAIPDSVTSIEYGAFYNCENLTNVTIPNSVTDIGAHAFYSCDNLKNIYYKGSQEEWNKINIRDNNNNLTNATIYYNFIACTQNNHNYFGDWTVVKKATCTTSGLKQRTCSYDGYTETIVIPATGHNFGNNSANCLVCGTANPNYVAPTPTPTQPTQTSKTVTKPKSAKIKKVKAAKKAVSVEWKKVSGVKGYQVQVATDKKFKKNKKTATVKKQKTTKVTIKKLKAKKKYYVRIRTYKTVKGKKIYSSWSKVKTVKTK